MVLFTILFGVVFLIVFGFYCFKNDIFFERPIKKKPYNGDHSSRWSDAAQMLQKFSFESFESFEFFESFERDNLNVDLFLKTLNEFFKYNDGAACLELPAFWLFSRNPAISDSVRNFIVEELQDLPLRQKISVLKKILFNLNTYYSVIALSLSSSDLLLLSEWYFNRAGLETFVETVMAVLRIRGSGQLLFKCVALNGTLPVDLLISEVIDKKNLLLIPDFISDLGKKKIIEDSFVIVFAALATTLVLYGVIVFLSA